MSIEDKDYFAWVNIKPKWLDIELSCRGTCWFDYRFLHPFDATMKYIEAFNVVYREMYRRYMNYKAFEHIRVLEPKDMVENFDKNRAAIIGCWHGRQVADAMGIPYEAYITDAYELRLRYWKRRYLPRPLALYSPLIVDQMPAMWQRRQENKMLFSEHPNFFAESYRDTKDQNDHHEWIFNQARLRSNPAQAVTDMVNRMLLPADKAQARYGNSLALH